MLLPTKGLTPDRCLIGLGSQMLLSLHKPRTVSALWTSVQAHRAKQSGMAAVDFDWFVLALDMLFTMGAVDRDRHGLLVRTQA